MEILTKSLPLESVEIKFDAEVPGRFSGYASAFNGVDSYGDTIIPGAFKKTLKKRERPIHMRWNHFGPVIGKWFEIREDEKGLYAEGELTLGHSVADDVYASLKHGAINGLSIGYRVGKSSETTNEDGTVVRELKEIELVEISVVETPADTGAKIHDVKAMIDEATSLKEIEKALRDAGLSRSDAVATVSRVKALSRGERDAEIEAHNLAEEIRKLTSKFGV